MKRSLGILRFFTYRNARVMPSPAPFVPRESPHGALGLGGRARLAASAIVLGGMLAANEARASEKEKCVGAFDRGQKAQSDRSLRRAEAELLVCAQEKCPSVLRADCIQVLNEVRAALPTVVLSANDGDGHDLTEVTVGVDGEAITKKLDGTAIPLDPGPHTIRFEARGAKAVMIPVTIYQGEKNRRISVSLPTSEEPRPAVATPGPVTEPREPKRAAIGFALPGALVVVGAASLIVAGASRAAFDSRVEDLRATCAPECTQNDRQDLSRTLTRSNVALGVGIGALGFAVVTWFLTAPDSPTKASLPTKMAFTW